MQLLKPLEKTESPNFTMRSWYVLKLKAPHMKFYEIVFLCRIFRVSFLLLISRLQISELSMNEVCGLLLQ